MSLSSGSVSGSIICENDDYGGCRRRLRRRELVGRRERARGRRQPGWDLRLDRRRRLHPMDRHDRRLCRSGITSEHARSTRLATGTPASARISRPRAWNVRTRTGSADSSSGASAAARRSPNSSAARLLNVTAVMVRGCVSFATSQQIRATSVVVLPLPMVASTTLLDDSARLGPRPPCRHCNPFAPECPNACSNRAHEHVPYSQGLGGGGLSKRRHSNVKITMKFKGMELRHHPDRATRCWIRSAAAGRRLTPRKRSGGAGSAST